MQLNTISRNGKRPLRKVGVYRNSILGNFASRQYGYFIDRPIEIKTILSRRRFFDVVADPVDDGSRAVGIARDVHDECRRDQFRPARFHTVVITAAEPA